ncbi:hypothetical protein F9C07_2110496 [Aspergillus flavus]|uniref:Uncharacterized protein n=1 Tax=Aspergillus flavus (strain ATCC 200026 / FGSC A1120 / IAM 13836 / NRRL 3357 / JCM 12722 / SRRC 167) TaxID=332952 RepID=A0A7U2R1D5_ASPFN|nr:hypothetical protein F9C07_2110496 [Aspergillus flavus]
MFISQRLLSKSDHRAFYETVSQRSFCQGLSRSHRLTKANPSVDISGRPDKGTGASSQHKPQESYDTPYKQVHKPFRMNVSTNALILKSTNFKSQGKPTTSGPRAVTATTLETSSKTDSPLVPKEITA